MGVDHLLLLIDVDMAQRVPVCLKSTNGGPHLLAMVTPASRELNQGDIFSSENRSQHQDHFGSAHRFPPWIRCKGIWLAFIRDASRLASCQAGPQRM